MFDVVTAFVGTLLYPRYQLIFGPPRKNKNTRDYILTRQWLQPLGEMWWATL
jgi:hypothetical protein